MSETKFRVGCAGPTDKWQRIGWDELISYAKERGVEIVYIDSEKPIEEQGKFDIIIHKMTYGMEGDKMKYFKYRDLYNYHKNHPEVIFIDDLDAVEMTSDRELLNKTIQSVQWPEGITISAPQAEMLYKNDIETIKEVTSHLHFPLLAKPKEGISNTAAHSMRIATTPEALVGVPVPCLLQEYVNHGAVVYKIYALGDHMEVTARTSSRDILPGENFVLDFHSQHSTDNNGFWDHTVNLKEVVIPYEKFAVLSKAIRKNLNLHLVGFDILIDKEGKYWIVDVNYFPGYKMIENLSGKFFSFFVDLYNHVQ